MRAGKLQARPPRHHKEGRLTHERGSDHEAHPSKPTESEIVAVEPEREGERERDTDRQKDRQADRRRWWSAVLFQ